MSQKDPAQISRRAAVKTVAGLSLGATVLPADAGNPFPAREPGQVSLAQAVWQFPDLADALTHWTRDQVVHLTEKLCGRRPVLVTNLAGPFCILVGTPQNNRFVKAAATTGLVEMERLAEDDYFIKQASIDGHTVLIIAGKTPRAAMYGVFDFFERLGCRFLLSRDVFPETDPALIIPLLDVLGQTDSTWRAIWFQYCFATNSIMSLDDYERMFDQLAKMRMNRVMYYHFENEPFIDYSYRGERKLIGDLSHPSSGYISYGRHFSGSYLVEDIPVGRDKFASRKRVAPMEFQDVESSDGALERGKLFMRRLIELAKARGIGTWITFLPTFVSMNMTKYTRPMPRTHLHWSGLVSCTDPVVTEINRNRFQSVVESYPDVEGILLAIPEGFFGDPYPETKELVAREWKNYTEALALMKEHWGSYWPGEQLQREHLGADIQFVEIVKNTIEVAKQVNPDVRLGIATVCKAYLLTYLHKILPKEMPFVDIESGSLWGGNPLHLFRRMQGRDCAIVPRAVDDGSMAGLQFNLNLYARDRFLASARENGTKGLVIQTTHIRGNEHNFKFLAQGMWNDELTPSQFYRDYAQTLFGPRAAQMMVQAYEVLEQNEQFLGGRGGRNMPWNKVPAEINALRHCRNFSLPFHRSPIEGTAFRGRANKFQRAVAYLEQADELFQESLTVCSVEGRGELKYLIRRNRAYAHHLRALVQMADVYISWSDALATLNDGIEQTRKKLRETLAQAEGAENEAVRSAELFAECVEHPTDLGVLWMINSSMVIGTRVLRQHVSNILAFYQGREYWNRVDWDLLFDDCPYPAHGLKKVAGGTVEQYEPG